MNGGAGPDGAGRVLMDRVRAGPGVGGVSCAVGRGLGRGLRGGAQWEGWVMVGGV